MVIHDLVTRLLLWVEKGDVWQRFVDVLAELQLLLTHRMNEPYLTPRGMNTGHNSVEALPLRSLTSLHLRSALSPKSSGAGRLSQELKLAP